MSNKPKYNPHIHHRRSIRLKGYDYAQAGLYFITICCHNRQCLFGEIVGANQHSPKWMKNVSPGWTKNISPEGTKNISPDNKTPKMILNDAGKIAHDCWLNIPIHFPNAVLHQHIIMPNHVHGIIELVGADGDNGALGGDNGAFYGDNGGDNGAKNVSPLRSPSKTIGSVVRGFKIGVTKWMRQNTDIYDVWQRNYYEHIIRNEKSYQTISEYIINNPAKWADDKFYSK